MADKRTEQIAIRITSETKEILRREAQKYDWTISKLAERILRKWTEGTKTNETGITQFFITHNENINL